MGLTSGQSKLIKPSIDTEAKTDFSHTKLRKAKMLVRFEDRSGDVEEVEMDIEEPCPICCGMLFLIEESKPDSGFRCSSCSLVFESVIDENEA